MPAIPVYKDTTKKTHTHTVSKTTLVIDLPVPWCLKSHLDSPMMFCPGELIVCDGGVKQASGHDVGIFSSIWRGGGKKGSGISRKQIQIKKPSRLQSKRDSLGVRIAPGERERKKETGRGERKKPKQSRRWDCFAASPKPTGRPHAKPGRPIRCAGGLDAWGVSSSGIYREYRRA